jgi:AraC-like DNA-binding protein
MFTYTTGANRSGTDSFNVNGAMQQAFGHEWEVTPVGSSDLPMVIKSVPLGQMKLSLATLPQARISNEARVGSSTSEHAYNIYVSNRRHVVMTNDRTVVLEPGDVTVADSAMPTTMTTREPYTTIGLTVPASVLRGYIPEPERAVGARFSCKTGFSKVVSSMLFTMWEHAESDDFDAIGTELANSLLGILSICCRVNLLQREVQNADMLAKQERIKRVINRNLRNPDLSVGELAKQFGLSIRYIQSLFSGEDCTVSKYIRHQRLEGCRRQLADPAWANHSITDIAFAWGFNSSAHFARVFKEEYGINAREYRKRSIEGLRRAG